MIFRIHFTLPDGTEDSIFIEGDSMDELRKKAHAEVVKRNATNPWSEQWPEEAPTHA